MASRSALLIWSAVSASISVSARMENAVGLGLSGSGIRSATFCLGVIQVLADRNLLKDVDYLSTVSGGGYAGSFLTRRLDLENAHIDVGASHGPDPGPVRYLRQHAKLSRPHPRRRWAACRDGNKHCGAEGHQH